MMLLDVVMETDHAGLDVAQWVRETRKNRLIRIVLRTGQRGRLPKKMSLPVMILMTIKKNRADIP